MAIIKKHRGLLSKQKSEAQKRGIAAALTGAGSVGAYWLLGGIPLIGTAVGIAGIGATGYMIWRWFQYRSEWGLRF